MKLKLTPEDFYVREIIDFSKKDPGETFQYFLMWKRNLTTIRAIKIISKKLKISKKRISFAGEKDKKAITEQYISIRGLRDFQERYDFGNVKLKYIGSFGEPIRISDISYNYFEIKAREVTSEELKAFEKNVDIYKEGFINYFDEQRFGDIRCNNHLIGKELIKRNWEEACKVLLTFESNNENVLATNARHWLKSNWGKWKEAITKFPKWLDIELAVLNYLVSNPIDFLGALKKLHKRLLKMFIHSYQSYLWNLAVSKFIYNNCENLKEIHLSFGELKIPNDKEFITQHKETRVPIIGYDTNLDKYSQFKKIYLNLLSQENISLEDFFFIEIPYLSSEGHERKMIETPKNLEYEIKEDHILLRFMLSRGTYATMLIKHLFIK